MSKPNLQQSAPILFDLLGSEDASARFDQGRKEELNFEFQAILRSPRLVAELHDLLLPNGAGAEAEFFETIDSFAHLCRRSQAGVELLAAVFHTTRNSLSVAETESILRRFSESGGFYIFSFLPALQYLFKGWCPEPKFLADWLLAVYQRIKGDLANGPFFSAVRSLSENHQETAYKLIDHFVSPHIDSDRIVLIAEILGAMRNIKTRNNSKFDEVEKRFSESSSSSKREAFITSWIATARARELSDDELSFLFGVLPEDKDERQALIFVCTRVALITDSASTRNRLLAWLDTALEQDPADLSKHHVDLPP